MTDKPTFKPMLAGKAPADLADLRFPVIASPKLDGIRCITWQGQALSRSLKSIPNQHVQECLAELPAGLDGELMVTGDFNAVQSAIMSRGGEPEFQFCVFDMVVLANKDLGADLPFKDRLACLEENCREFPHPHVQVVPHQLVHSIEELIALDAKHIEAGSEGTMIRDPEGPYKCGRSTTKQGWLLKLKLFWDEEAEIIGLEEQMHNANEATTDELGHTKRSTHKENKVPMGTLGKFLCRFDDGTEFKCGGGPGVTAALRQKLWDERSHPKGTCFPSCIGKRATIRYQAVPGRTERPEGEKPRIPQFHGFRHEDDQ